MNGKGADCSSKCGVRVLMIREALNDLPKEPGRQAGYVCVK